MNSWKNIVSNAREQIENGYLDLSPLVHHTSGVDYTGLFSGVTFRRGFQFILDGIERYTLDLRNIANTSVIFDNCIIQEAGLLNSTILLDNGSSAPITIFKNCKIDIESRSAMLRVGARSNVTVFDGMKVPVDMDISIGYAPESCISYKHILKDSKFKNVVLHLVGYRSRFIDISEMLDNCSFSIFRIADDSCIARKRKVYTEGFNYVLGSDMFKDCIFDDYAPGIYEGLISSAVLLPSKDDVGLFPRLNVRHFLTHDLEDVVEWFNYEGIYLCKERGDYTVYTAMFAFFLKYLSTLDRDKRSDILVTALTFNRMVSGYGLKGTLRETVLEATKECEEIIQRPVNDNIYQRALKTDVDELHDGYSKTAFKRYTWNSDNENPEWCLRLCEFLLDMDISDAPFENIDVFLESFDDDSSKIYLSGVYHKLIELYRKSNWGIKLSVNDLGQLPFAHGTAINSSGLLKEIMMVIGDETIPIVRSENSDEFGSVLPGYLNSLLTPDESGKYSKETVKEVCRKFAKEAWISEDTAVEKLLPLLGDFYLPDIK